MKKLADPQKEIYDFILTYAKANGYPPTVREICLAVGLKSPSTVHTHLKNMEAKGLIKRDASKQRAMAIHESVPAPPVSDTFTHSSAPIPLVGKVAAGMPVFAAENVEDAFPLPHLLMHGSQADELFMLYVDGESMIDAGIRPDDIIVVNRNLRCEDGDIGVARIRGEEATVKRIYREKDHLRLQPENIYFPVIEVSYDEAEVIGKVVGLLRQY